jgi:hypothetical protein
MQQSRSTIKIVSVGDDDSLLRAYISRVQWTTITSVQIFTRL